MSMTPIDPHTPETLRKATEDSVDRLLRLVKDLTPRQRIGPFSRTLNPPLWEMSHSLWFMEKSTLRDILDFDPYFDDVDHIYNSIRIRLGKRWAVDLIPLNRIQEFAEYLVATIREELENRPDHDPFHYRVLYSVFHNDMHTEAITFQRQSRGLPAPEWVGDFSDNPTRKTPTITGEEVEIDGGTLQLGARRNKRFCFDNEKWAHPVDVPPFTVDRTPVTQGQYAQFVEDGGYEEKHFWTDNAWEWLLSSGQDKPLYWRRAGNEWEQRIFDRWVPLQKYKPMIHVSNYEAEAYCSWAGRRLPTEAEWVYAASTSPQEPQTKRPYPWGNESPTPRHANLDWDPVERSDIDQHPQGDSGWGCRQMIGNVWEWTSTCFEPFDGFEADFYQEYSQPWFGSRKVMRGGSWATRSRLIRNGFRNFYTPDRNDRYLGFRTCGRNG